MNKSSNGYDCVANGTNGATVIQNGSARKIGPPNYGATVIDSRAVDYLLMKLRSKDTESKVKVCSELIQTQRNNPFMMFLASPLLQLSNWQEFMVYGDRLMTILAEEALCRLPSVVVGQVETPCGTAHGLVDDKTKGKKTCLVSVVRSGKLPQRI